MDMKKKMSLYMKIYLSVLAAGVLLLVAASVVLWTVLDAYESTRPKYVAEQVFNDYFKTAKIGALMQKFPTESAAFEDVNSIYDGISEKYDPSKFQYFSVSTDENGNEQYAVTCDNKRIAYFTVSPTNKKAAYGFKYYELSGAEVFLGSYGDVAVKVPKGYKLQVNGIDVAASYITTADIKSASCDYMPEGVNGIMYDKYTVTGLVFEPTLKVTDANGTETTLTYNDEEECYEAGIVYNTTLAEKHEDYILKAMREYTKYLSNDATFGAVSGYLDKNSPLYGRVRSVEVEWVRDHSGYKISNEKVEEYYQYSEDIFSCRASLKETLMRPGYDDYHEFIDLTLYLRRVDGKFLIYEMITN